MSLKRKNRASRSVRKGFSSKSSAGFACGLALALLVPLQAYADDTDGDGLDDAWEMLHFGDLSHDNQGDPDGDGYLNSEEEAFGTDPQVWGGVPFYLSHDGWFGVSGAGVSDLVNSGIFYQSPDVSGLVLGASQSLDLDEYGGRLRGTITAPVTGSYTFWVAGDDSVEFWLSSDDRKFSRQRLAWSDEATGLDEWDKFVSQQSTPLCLMAGQKYYLEVLHKEGYFVDHVSVAWSYEVDDLVNWVREPGVVASQSSTVAGGVASRAIDGNRDGIYASRSTTYTNPNRVNSWWEVDLGADRNLERVILYNREDGVPARLSNFTISVLDAQGVVVASQLFHNEEGHVETSLAWDLSAPVLGRKVRVQLDGVNLNGDGTIHLAEVEVMGSVSGAGNATPLGYLTNWTQESGVGAAQSSTVAGGVASRAIDGNRDGVYGNGSVTYTNPNVVNTWWQVDLGVERPVSRIALFNRVDGNILRLSNFRIILLDDAGTEVVAEDFFTDGGHVNYQMKWDVPAGSIARKVRIERLGPNLQGDHTLHFAEVEVLGSETMISGAIQGREPLPIGALESYALDADDPDDDGLPSAWETQYGFDPAVAEGLDQGAFGDPDGDLISNWQEYQLDLDPTVANSIQGALTQEVWNGINGRGLLEDLYSNPKFYQTPDSRGFVYESEATRYLGSGLGVRVRGYIEAPETGDYRFWLSGSAEVRCWLSSDDSKFNKELLISPHLYSAFRQYGLEASQQSVIVPMVAGQKYFLEMHYGERGAGGFSPVSLAWQRPGEELSDRRRIPGEFLYSFVPHLNDLDDDDLPDDWEIANGLDHTDNGGINIANSAHGDLDGDGLTNQEEYEAGTRADLVDSDGDGVNDYDEVKVLQTNAIVGDVAPFQLEQTVNGSAIVASEGTWGTAGTSAYSRDVRGWVEYDINVPFDGLYLLEVALSPRLSGGLSSDYGYVFSIDGIEHERVNISMLVGETGTAATLTPWLTQGVHRVRFFDDNALTFRRINIETLKVLSAQGSDASGNGVPDWVDYHLTQNNALTTLSTFSKVSPARIAGTARHFETMTLSGGLQAIPLINDTWALDLPLSENTATTLTADFENGGLTDSLSVTWEPTNLLSEATLVLRQNESLRLTAFTGNSANGSDKVWLTIAGTTYNFKGKDPMVWLFDTAGTHLIDIVHQKGNGKKATQTTHQVTVEVIAPTTVSSPVVMPTHVRSWTVPALPAGAVLEFDDRIEVRDIIPQADGSTRYLITTYENDTYYAQVRLAADGALLQSIPVRGLIVRDAEATSVSFVQNFGDGSYQVDMPTVVTTVYDDIVVHYNIFLAGIVFDTGGIDKDYFAADFDPLGQALVTFIKTGTDGSNCHRTKVYQNGVLIADFF